MNMQNRQGEILMEEFQKKKLFDAKGTSVSWYCTVKKHPPSNADNVQRFDFACNINAFLRLLEGMLGMWSEWVVAEGVVVCSLSSTRAGQYDK